MDNTDIAGLLKDMEALMDVLNEHDCQTGVEIVKKAGIIIIALSSFYFREMGKKTDPSDNQNSIH
jgi:hypothetical protein